MANEKSCVCAKMGDTIKKHKGLTAVIALIILAIVVGCFVCCGKTEMGKNGPVAVLDVEKIRNEAEAYKTVAAEQKKYEEVWKTKFTADKEVLDKEDQALAARRKSMKPSELKAAVAMLQRKAIALQQKYQAEAGKIMAATESVMVQIDKVVIDAAKTEAKKAGYMIVLPKQATIYAAETVDFTETFIKELNTKSVKVTYPDPDTLTPQPMQ